MRLGTFDVERKGALAREAEVASCTPLELIGFVALTDRAGELERLQVVVSEDIRQVLDALARLLLDPGGGGPVAGGASGAWDLPVADVSHEQMPEAVLLFALHRGGAGGAHELLPRELVQRLFDLCQVPLSDFRERAGPEDLAQDRRVLEQALAVGAQRVEAGGDQRMHGVRHLLDRRRLSSVREQAHELLSVEGVSARALKQLPLRLG